MSIALDSTALIYALDRVARRDHERADCERVHDFVRWLREVQREEIQVPALALSEMLAFFGDEDTSARLTAILRRGFLITPTDIRCGVEAARLWGQLGGKEFRKRMKADFDISKQCIKTDIQIVATAKVHGATKIIAVDHGVVVASRTAGLEPLQPADCVVQESRAPTAGSALFENRGEPGGEDPPAV